MPWKETDVMNLRSQFVEAFESGLFGMTELCKEYKISRPTGYLWVSRSVKGEPSEMLNLSRAPHTCPHRTPPDVVDAIIEFRRKHPSWGPRKVIATLRRDNPKVGDRLPAVSTAGDILKAAGLVATRRRRPRCEHPGSTPVVANEPNDEWYIDFKGEFRLGNTVMCYPLTVTDAFTRSVLCCDGLTSTAHVGTQKQLQQLFERVGMPKAMRSDNGCPFCSPAIGGISRLSIWWTKLGIFHDRSRPANPQDNGQHERMHRDLKAETTRPPGKNMAQQQERFDAFRHEFNQVRPHEALEMATPASIWQPSLRTMPARLPEPEYPGHMEVRTVGKNGHFKFAGQAPFISLVLSRERIALEEVDDHIWSIQFYDRLLAKLDLRTGKIVATIPKPSIKDLHTRTVLHGGD
jgi:putative transposase